ncbi:MAG: protein kinase [Isosphaeraceae bacterium]
MTEETIFNRALEKPAEERAAFLDEVCAGDVPLRDRLDVLLRAHDNPGSFLASPAAGLGANADTTGGGTADEGSVRRPTGEGPGSRIGPYKLLEAIGEGGMGSVYMAEQTAPVRRMVALKVIKPGMDSRLILARFEAERQALALMDHPNIARVLDAGTTEQGRPYFVMELVKGIAITRYCDERKLTPRERLELFVPVCRAVQHAHQKGIIHRDLKPSNVLVALYDGRPVSKVIDFGVAKATGPALTEATLFTGFGTVVGTPEYMSPEQAELNQLDVDTRSDVYSLGVLLYELLTGTTPLDRGRLKQAAILEVLRVIREEEPLRPSTRLSTAEELPSIAASRNVEPRRLAGLLRGDLDWIAMKALDKDRNRRYETATGLAADVERYLADEPVLAGPPSATYRFRKFVRRHRKPVALAALAVAFLLIGAVVSTWQAIRATRAEGLAERRLESEKAERERAARAERAAKLRWFETLLAEARAGRWGRRRGQRLDGLRTLDEAARLARELRLDPARFREIRDEAIACLALFDIHRISSVAVDGPPGGNPRTVMDADLGFLARRDRRGEVVVRSLVDSRELVRLGNEARGGTVMEFSPNGQFLALRLRDLPAGRANVQVWDWRRAELVFRPDLRVDTEAVGFSPDNRLVALGPADGTVRIHELVSGAEVRRLDSRLGATHLAFSPDGVQLAVASQTSGTVRVFEVATGRLVATLSHPDQVMGLAWHPHDPLLAIANHDHRVYLWDLPESKLRTALEIHRHIVHTVAFSPEGGLLLSQGSDGSRLTDLATGQQVLILEGLFRRFSPDGRRTASVRGDRIEIWGLDSPREYRTVMTSSLARHPESRGQFSPDGRWLAAPVQDGVQLWDATSGRLVARLPMARADAVRFHPSGRELFLGGRRGLERWPFVRGPGSLRIGPPREILGPTSVASIDLDRGGRLLAAADTRGLWIVDLGPSPAPPRHLEHPSAFFAAVSPDGRWVASGALSSMPAVRIWEPGSGRVLRDLQPESSFAAVDFSPDGRWFATGTREHGEQSLREVDSWREVWRFVRTDRSVPSLAFSADAGTFAIKGPPEEVQLLDPATGQSLASLRAPYGDQWSWLALSHDGSRLAAGILGQRGIGIWDLRRVRRRLAEMGLDWGSPPDPANPPPDADESIPVQVVTAQPEPETPPTGGDP